MRECWSLREEEENYCRNHLRPIRDTRVRVCVNDVHWGPILDFPPFFDFLSC